MDGASVKSLGHHREFNLRDLGMSIPEEHPTLVWVIYENMRVGRVGEMVSGSKIIVRVQMVEDEGSDDKSSFRILSSGQGRFLVLWAKYEGVQIDGLKELRHGLRPRDVVVVTQFFREFEVGQGLD